MKKLLLMVFGVLIALPTFAREFSYTYEGQTLYYTVISEENKTCKTKDGYSNRAGNNVSGELVIPEVAADGTTAYSVIEIGDEAFLGCSGLTSVTIPNSVTTIGERAFYRCGALTSVYYNTEDPIKVSESIFDSSTYSNGTLYVPEAGVEECKYTSPWNKFNSIQAFDFSSVDEIKTALAANAPYEIYNLNGVKVGDNIDALAPGIYIVRQGATTKKIAVK